MKEAGIIIGPAERFGIIIRQELSGFFYLAILKEGAVCRDEHPGGCPGGVFQPVFGINEDSTGIAPYHNFDSIIPQAVKDAVNKAIDDMKAGKIKVPATRAEAGYKG